MSRVSYNEDMTPFEYGRWERRVQQVLNGRRGQEALRELEAALLALPQPRLVAGYLAEVWPPDVPESAGAVEACALGALALYKGVPLPAWAAETDEYELPDWDATVTFGVQDLGLRQTLAWLIVEQNDDPDDMLRGFGRVRPETPEERHARVLKWVRGQLKAVPA